MRIDEYLAAHQTALSFEFFPPKTEAGETALEATLAELRSLNPAFVSVTCGAGGSTQGRTLDLAARIRAELGIEAMAHLTCVGQSSAEIAAALDRFHTAGIENVMALRGDPPGGTGAFPVTESGFGHGSELIAFIRAASFDFCVGGAAYPEGHVESQDRHVDLRYLLEKQDCGASFFIAQLFFDNAFYFRLAERARRAGVSAPILAGIMPIEDAAQIRRFALRCGATIPARLAAVLDRCDGPEQVRQAGVEWATDQCAELLAEGVPGLHFYTLNRSRATCEILQALGRLPDSL